MIIYLDLDGVIINWVKGIFNWFEIPYDPSKVTHWDSMYEITNTTKQGFWTKIKFSAFWENLDFYPDSRLFIDRIKKYGEVILLSSPAYGCAGYRQNWIEKNLPEFFNNGHYILTPSKWTCAHKNTILIDDSDENYQKFIQNGGNAIIYPQPWNITREIFKQEMSEQEKNNLVIATLKMIKIRNSH